MVRKCTKLPPYFPVFVTFQRYSIVMRGHQQGDFWGAFLQVVGSSFFGFVQQYNAFCQLYAAAFDAWQSSSGKIRFSVSALDSPMKYSIARFVKSMQVLVKIASQFFSARTAIFCQVCGEACCIPKNWLRLLLASGRTQFISIDQQKKLIKICAN